MSITRKEDNDFLCKRISFEPYMKSNDALKKRWENQWDQSFGFVKVYLQETGQFPQMRTTHNGHHIGQWLAKQKRLYKTGKLSYSKIKKLQDIGFDFEFSNKEMLDNRWDQNFEMLKEFIVKNQRPPKCKEIYNGYKLGAWFNLQKTMYRNHKLAPEREEKLHSIGIDIDVLQGDIFDNKWNTAYVLLKEYIETNGHLPGRNVEYKGCRLGRWVNTQQTMYIHDKVSAEREAKLRSLGVPLKKDSRNQSWEQHYAVLQEFISEEGQIPKHDTIYKECNIGSWLAMQRRMFKENKMSKYREDKLAALGVQLLRKAK